MLCPDISILDCYFQVASDHNARLVEGVLVDFRLVNVDPSQWHNLYIRILSHELISNFRLQDIAGVEVGPVAPFLLAGLVDASLYFRRLTGVDQLLVSFLLILLGRSLGQETIEVFGLLRLLGSLLGIERPRGERDRLRRGMPSS